MDRMTINFSGEHECRQAAELRRVLGYRGVNHVLKQLIADYLAAHPPLETSSKES